MLAQGEKTVDALARRTQSLLRFVEAYRAMARPLVPRAEVIALAPWLEEHGFAVDETLLLRRTVDSEGRSRAWINGSAATVAQLKALADGLVDIHGQHAWQSLTRADAVRELLDAYAGIDTGPAARAWAQWRQRKKALDEATKKQHTLQQESERLSWQIAEVDKLAPQVDEWDELNAQHSRLANAQSLLDAAQIATDALDEADTNAAALIHRALSALQDQARLEPQFASAIEALEAALAQVQDTVHHLHQYSRHTEQDPASLEALDQRLSLWVSLARRYRRTPEELAQVHAQWKAELAEIDQALDINALEKAERADWKAFTAALQTITKERQKAAPKLSKAVTATMQTLGMEGGAFEVALVALDEPQAHGAEQVEFRVAGHAGATPKPVGKVASGARTSACCRWARVNSP